MSDESQVLSLRPGTSSLKPVPSMSFIITENFVYFLFSQMLYYLITLYNVTFLKHMTS